MNTGILGIDPGVHGGIAFLRGKDQGSDGHGVVELYSMPETESDLWSLVGACKGVQAAIVEKTSLRPIKGIGIPASMGKLMRNYGALLMALTAKGIAIEEVLPQKWQKALGCLTHGDKSITKRKAQQLYPDVTITYDTADALLLAHYGKVALGYGRG